jgi:hypothetical protein
VIAVLADVVREGILIALVDELTSKMQNADGVVVPTHTLSVNTVKEGVVF